MHSTKQQLFFYQRTKTFLILIIFLIFFPFSIALAAPLIKNDVLTQFNNLPLSFEKNNGQVDSSIHYFSRGTDYMVYLTSQEMGIVLQKPLQENKSDNLSILKLKFKNAQVAPVIQGIKKLEQKSHYFIGNDPEKWRTSIPHYASVYYQNLYSGIDATFYGNPQQIEYDILVAPNSDPKEIQLHVVGAQELLIDPEGNLHMVMEDQQEVQMLKPIVYQMQGANKTLIEGEFVLLAPDVIGFAIGDYDKNHVLIIDPVLTYSTYLGGSAVDQGFSIAVDSEGNAYVAGTTFSMNFPTTTHAFQTAPIGMINAFVTKLNATGTALVYSTYLGGSTENLGNSIAVDPQGHAYLTGQTSSANFPTTVNAFRTTPPGSINAFVTKLNLTGSALEYSTYLGGTLEDIGNSIVVDLLGNAYITGQTNSMDFPTTTGAFQTLAPAFTSAFVTKLNPAGSALVYSTYLGGSTVTIGNSIALDNAGNAHVTGQTDSLDFPITVGAFQTTPPSASTNAFVTKFNSTGSAPLLYSTYLGGSNIDISHSIVLDSVGHAYVTGLTSSLDFPTTPGAFQTTSPSPYTHAFVTKINLTAFAPLVYSTYLGGSNIDIGNSIALDNQGNGYVTGITFSTDFPITAGAFQAMAPGSANAFVTKLDATGSLLIYSSYLGGSNPDFGNSIAVDQNGNAFLTGRTDSINFPTTLNAFQTQPPASTNAFVTKISIGTPTITSVNPNQNLNTGTVVIITGTNFTNAIAVYFGSVPARFVINSDTQITAILPPGIGIGVAPVTVITLGGTSPIIPVSQVVVNTALPPLQLKGFQKLNRFATQTEYVNILTWKAPVGGTPIKQYRIYRDAEQTQLIAVVCNHSHLKFKDHHRKKGKIYSYFVVSVDQFGNVSTPATVKINTISQ